MNIDYILRMIGWMIVIALLAALVLVMFIGTEDGRTIDIVPDMNVEEKIK